MSVVHLLLGEPPDGFEDEVLTLQIPALREDCAAVYGTDPFYLLPDAVAKFLDLKHEYCVQMLCVTASECNRVLVPEDMAPGNVQVLAKPLLDSEILWKGHDGENQPKSRKRPAPDPRGPRRVSARIPSTLADAGLDLPLVGHAGPKAAAGKARARRARDRDTDKGDESAAHGSSASEYSESAGEVPGNQLPEDGRHEAEAATSADDGDAGAQHVNDVLHEAGLEAFSESESDEGLPEQMPENLHGLAAAAAAADQEDSNQSESEPDSDSDSDSEAAKPRGSTEPASSQPAQPRQPAPAAPRDAPPDDATRPDALARMGLGFVRTPGICELRFAVPRVGELRYNISSCFYRAHCPNPNHEPDCARRRTAVRGTGRAGQGRPLGLLVHWLQQAYSCRTC